ncbi:MAG: hypothetical protein AAB354_04085 [candidate division KSB1 bacterium]
MTKQAMLSSPTSDLSKFEGLALEDAIDLLKAYMFQRHQATFLRDGVRLYFDPSTTEVFLFDNHAKMAKLEYSELKQWAMCLRCGVKGFVEGVAPCFVNDTTCAACASIEQETRHTSKRMLSHLKRKA